MEFRADKGMFEIIALTDLSSSKSSCIWKVRTRFELGSQARVAIIHTNYIVYEEHASIIVNRWLELQILDLTGGFQIPFYDYWDMHC